MKDGYIDSSMAKFYSLKSKFEQAQCFVSMREDISPNSAVDTLSYATELMETKAMRTLHRYHYELLREAIKITLQQEHAHQRAVSGFTNILLDHIEAICIMKDPVIHKSVLKLVIEISKSYSSLLNSDKFLKLILHWFSLNDYSYLDIYFLKLLGITINGNCVDKTDYSAIFLSLRLKGYTNVGFPNSYDCFISTNSSTLFMQCQAHALEITINTITSLMKAREYGILENLFEHVPLHNEINLIQQYIKRYLHEDDNLLLSNLIAVNNLSKILQSYPNSTHGNYDLYEFLMVIGDAFYWFCYFLSHINLDHKIVIDWFLDENEKCVLYITSILSFISDNLRTFFDYFCYDQARINGVNHENVKDFFVRLGLGLPARHKSVGELIEVFETQYETKVNDSNGFDPLSSVLYSQFNSKCTIDDNLLLESCEQSDDKAMSLVAYSDSD